MDRNESENLLGRERTLESLEQLVAALDRRAPRHDQPAHGQQDLDVSELRDEARLRIDRLNHAADAAADLQARSDEAMTDDGAPVAAERRG